MPVYKYDGATYGPFGEISLVSNHYVTADNISSAVDKIKARVARDSGYSKRSIHIDNSLIKEVESMHDKKIRLNKNPYENTCEECGAQLTNSGDCPVCDYGEEDYFEESLLETIRKLNQLED